MTGIHPFEVSFSAAGIDDLRRRLQQAIYPDELDNVNWDLGSPLTDVQWLAKHWATSFNFKQAEQLAFNPGTRRQSTDLVHKLHVLNRQLPTTAQNIRMSRW